MTSTKLDFKEREFKKRGSKEATMGFFGVLKEKNIDWKANEKRMKSFRDEFEERLQIREKEISFS